MTNFARRRIARRRRRDFGTKLRDPLGTSALAQPCIELSVKLIAGHRKLVPTVEPYWAQVNLIARAMEQIWLTYSIQPRNAPRQWQFALLILGTAGEDPALANRDPARFKFDLGQMVAQSFADLTG